MCNNILNIYIQVYLITLFVRKKTIWILRLDHFKGNNVNPKIHWIIISPEAFSFFFTCEIVIRRRLRSLGRRRCSKHSNRLYSTTRMIDTQKLLLITPENWWHNNCLYKRICKSTFQRTVVPKTYAGRIYGVYLWGVH